MCGKAASAVAHPSLTEITDSTLKSGRHLHKQSKISHNGTTLGTTKSDIHIMACGDVKAGIGILFNHHYKCKTFCAILMIRIFSVSVAW